MVGKVSPQLVERAGLLLAGAIDDGRRRRFQKGRLKYGREGKR